MHIVVITHKLLHRTKKGLRTTGGFPVQIDALAPYFERITLCSPLVEAPNFIGTPLRSPQISVWPLPAYESKLDFARRFFNYASQIRAAIRQADIVLCMTPGYIGILGSWLAQRSKVPMFQYVVGDWALNFGVRTGSKTRRVLSTVISPLLNGFMARLTRNALTFFNGDVLYGGVPGLHFSRVSSSLTSESFFEREDTCRAAPYRLLFVGRLAGEKGISYLVQAVALLQKQDVPIVLDLVGDGPERQGLEHLVKRLCLERVVTLHGFVPQGRRLDEMYRTADIFVLPSLEDRQPKVLLEAMANSVPVVASRTGGVPTHVRHEQTGLLVEPRDIAGLAGSVERLIRDPDLRRRLILEGMAYARAHTVEAETERTMQIVFQHFGFHGRSG